MNESEQRMLRTRDSEDFLRTLSADARREYYRRLRQLDEMTAHWQWIDELEAILELALAAAAERVFNWPPRYPREPTAPHYDPAADLGTLRHAAENAPPTSLHVITFEDLEAAQDRLMRELAEYYDTHDSITGLPFDQETQA